MKIIKVTQDQFENNQADGNVGYCLNCGEEHYGIEPDACKYECECCEQNAVYGFDEIILMGLLQIVDDDE